MRIFRYLSLVYFRDYLHLERPVRNVIAAEFFLQLINVAFLSIQIIYMQKEGYSDHDSAGFISFRFLGVLLLAVPLGLYIKGRAIYPLFYISAFMVPTMALLIILATEMHWRYMLYVAMFCWGMGFTFIQTPVLPFILRNSAKRNQTGGIALSYSTYSFGGIATGVVIALLNKINPVWFSERNMLIGLSLLAYLAVYYLRQSKFEEHLPATPRKTAHMRDHDWPIIIKALVPTLIIAVGAGLTIPFIGIFFFNVHHLSTSGFAVMNGVASVLVAISAMLVPYIKRTIGYKIAIPTTQSFAVLALALLATTEFYSRLGIALVLAVICFLLRQPLMNVAGPMTSELVMSYVGKKNQEMVSALTAAIWSGSWFISSLIFKVLRQSQWPYVYIFLITAFLYSIGVIWYYRLILDYNKREKAREIGEALT